MLEVVCHDETSHFLSPQLGGEGRVCRGPQRVVEVGHSSRGVVRQVPGGGVGQEVGALHAVLAAVSLAPGPARPGDRGEAESVGVGEKLGGRGERPAQSDRVAPRAGAQAHCQVVALTVSPDTTTSSHQSRDLLSRFIGIFGILIIPLMRRAGGYPVASEPKLKTERLRTIWKLTGKYKNQDPRNPFFPGASPGAESRMVQL